jgi:hypothetical protein
MMELNLDNARALEALIIEAMYLVSSSVLNKIHASCIMFFPGCLLGFCVISFVQGLLKGTMDQKNGLLRVSSVMARDVHTEDIQGLIQMLENW